MKVMAEALIGVDVTVNPEVRSQVCARRLGCLFAPAMMAFKGPGSIGEVARRLRQMNYPVTNVEGRLLVTCTKNMPESACGRAVITPKPR